MSDPVTNVEIEDVLASIRRLVSQGQREDDAQEKSVPDAADRPPAVVDRLVLTPAHRVHAAAAPQAETEAEPEESPAPAVSVAGLVARDHFDLNDSEGGEVKADQPDAEEAEQQDDVSEPTAPTSRKALFATIAELEAAVDDGDQGFESDEASKEPDLDWDTLSEKAVAEADADFEQVTAAYSGEVGQDDPVAVEDAEGQEPRDELHYPAPDPSERGSRLTLRMAEPQPRFGGTVIDLGRSASTGPTAAEPEADAAAQPEPEVAAIPEEPPAPMAPTLGDPGSPPSEDVLTSDTADGSDLDDDLSSYLAEEASIDEEVLRDLVAEIVREELQGELGERITRNVRKLVRREIYRVMSSQDFD